VRQFYLDPDAPDGLPAPGEERLLGEEESRHLLRVLRARPGHRVLLTDGRGHAFTAELTGGDARAARVRVVEVRRDEDELRTPRLVLACGLIKGKRWEGLLEAAVELGAHAVVPLLAQRAEVDPGAGRQRRWRTILLTALKQSGRTWCPDLAEPMDLAGFLAAAPGEVFYGRARDRNRPALDPALATPAAVAAAAGAAPPALVWCVGPEGGWDDHESDLLAAHGRAVRLGPHRLRTATAAAAGLMLLSARREALLAADAGPRPAPGA